MMSSIVKILSRFAEFPVQDVTMDDALNVYFMKDETIYKIRRGDPGRMIILNTDDVCGMAADAKNNIYLASSDHISVLKSYHALITLDYFKERDCEIKYVTTDVHDNVYVLANLGHGGDHAYKILDEGMIKLPLYHQVRKPFAVDSCRRVYYDTYCLDIQSKCPIHRLYDEIVNSVCVDKLDNVYYGTDSGLFVVKAGTYKAFQVKEVNVPKIVKVGVNIDNSIYFSSMDEKKGGIYMLKEY